MAATLRDHRERKGKTLEAAAYEAGLSYSLLYKYETGRTIPGGRNLRKLANYYGLSVDDVLAAIEAARKQAANGRAS